MGGVAIHLTVVLEIFQYNAILCYWSSKEILYSFYCIYATCYSPNSPQFTLVLLLIYMLAFNSTSESDTQYRFIANPGLVV